MNVDLRFLHIGIDVSHVSSYQFNEPGKFEIVCQEDDELRALILVDYGHSTNTSEAEGATEMAAVRDTLLPLLYSHAAVMGITFGILFPVGAYMAYHYFTTVHIVLQAISMIGTVSGLVLVVVYVELTHEHHFRFPIHGVVGLALILLVLIMPFLRLHRRVREYHHKLGQIVAFFGMANVLLVST